jgi:methylthioribose-1-phosphate isomerase
MIRTLYWKNGNLFVLDQRLLPHKKVYIRCRTSREVARTIQDMAVRGAPAIGVTAAYGIALAAREKKFSSVAAALRHLNRAADQLAATRPTAVNLFWAIKRMKQRFDQPVGTVAGLAKTLEQEAAAVYAEDIEINRRIGDNGAAVLKKGSTVLTHCNAGALATAGYGTALGVIRSARKQGRVSFVYVDETRPYLQGARLTAWEMLQEKIPYALITDNMAGHFMQSGVINAVIVGADRIAANGDTANKIGTYALAVLARYHNIPFYIAAPVSTIDLSTPSGKKIVIEQRSVEEVTMINGKRIAAKGTHALHPAFDVTPAELITAIITEKGVFKPQAVKTIPVVC